MHLPVQAGSDRILTAMKRGYSVLEYKSIIRRLKAARPGIAIATDFIVGFPGETAEDFEKTMRLMLALALSIVRVLARLLRVCPMKRLTA